uniref:Uncharacterized protein n=1 Tax=Moschus moschiferus TaxID=68415 RepID=A0A8C6FG62_MOSMO
HNIIGQLCLNKLKKKDHRFDRSFPRNSSTGTAPTQYTDFFKRHQQRVQKAVKRKGVPNDGLKFKCLGQRKPESSS